MTTQKSRATESIDHGKGFNQVEKVVLYKQVSNQIKAAILEGNYKPGDRLPTERELSISFGVGRPTIREALRTLTVRGLIELSRESRGYVVKSPDLEYYIEPIREQISWIMQVSEKTIPDFWEVIPHLLGIIAHSAVYRSADVGFLFETIEKMKNGNDFYSVSPLTYNFGRKLAELTGNRVVNILWKMFKNVILDEYPPVLEKRETAGPAKLIEFHEDILKAVEIRDHAAIDAAVADRREYLRDL